MQACRTAHGKAANVRFGSKADMTPFKRDVRFTPESGHFGRRSACLLCADFVAKVVGDFCEQ
jgi:hypothetical protein